MDADWVRWAAAAYRPTEADGVGMRVGVLLHWCFFFFFFQRDRRVL